MWFRNVARFSIYFDSFHVNLEWFLMPKQKVNKHASLLGMWHNVLVLVMMFRGSPQSSLSINNYDLPPNPWVLYLFKLQESETLKAQIGKQKHIHHHIICLCKTSFKISIPPLFCIITYSPFSGNRRNPKITPPKIKMEPKNGGLED